MLKKIKFDESKAILTYIEIISFLFLILDHFLQVLFGFAEEFILLVEEVGFVVLALQK